MTDKLPDVISALENSVVKVEMPLDLVEKALFYLKRYAELYDSMTPFDVLDTLSAAWFGQQVFFQQNDGDIYDRDSGEYISFDEAVRRFERRIQLA